MEAFGAGLWVIPGLLIWEPCRRGPRLHHRSLPFSLPTAASCQSRDVDLFPDLRHCPTAAL